MKFIVKSTSNPGFTGHTDNLESAQFWRSEQSAPLNFSIWKFVGSNPNKETHYTCVQVEGE